MIIMRIVIILRGSWSTGFLDYILARTPGDFRRLSEMSVGTNQASCRYSRKTVFSRLLPKISVENRSLYPVPESSHIIPQCVELRTSLIVKKNVFRC